jgi:hypothetical protein
MLGGGGGLKSPHREKQVSCEILQGVLQLDGFLGDDIRLEKWEYEMGRVRRTHMEKTNIRIRLESHKEREH